MAIPHVKPGEIVDVRPIGSALPSTQTKTLFRAKHMEVIRLVIRAGKEIQEHKARDETIVQCLEGIVAFTAFGKKQILESGQLLYLPAGEPHALRGIEDASLLLTVIMPND